MSDVTKSSAVSKFSDVSKFDVRDWLVPPVLLPIFFALLIVAAVAVQW